MKRILLLVPINDIVAKSIFRTPPWCMVLLHITQARLEPGKPSCEIFAVKREIYLTFAKYSHIRENLCPKIWWQGKSFQSRLKSFCQIKGLSTFLSRPHKCGFGKYLKTFLLNSNINISQPTLLWFKVW